MLEENIRKVISGRAIPVRGDDIDTDRIIPARYLKCITFDELGQYVFYDERFDEKGRPKEHPFNDERFKGAEILLVNRNFGCGSSREHAPQSIMRAGIKAIVGESFAEIFFGNCIQLGIPAVRLDHESIEELMAIVEKNPGTRVTVDIEKRIVRAGEKEYEVEIDESARNLFINGTWDTTSMLLSALDEIKATASKLPYINGFA